VYPDPKSHSWQLPYKSNACPTVEDAVFEVKYWVEEDMSIVLGKMEAGDMWAADVQKEAPKNVAPKKNGEGVGGEEKMQGVEKDGGGEEKADRSTSPETVNGDDDKAKDKGKQPIAPTADTTTSILKRKARDDDDKERAKSRKNEEEERVFIREMGPSPKKEVKSLFGGDGGEKKDSSPGASALFGGGELSSAPKTTSVSDQTAPSPAPKAISGGEPDMIPVKLKPKFKPKYASMNGGKK
jgi:hypothetical protein